MPGHDVAGEERAVCECENIRERIAADAHVRQQRDAADRNQERDDMEVLLVSITEAATTLNLGRTSVYKLMDESKLESRKLGRRRLITAASIRRLVEYVA